MVYEERNTWVALVTSAIATVVYVAVVLARAGDGPLTEVNWWPVMATTIGGAILVSIAVGIGWGIIAGAKDPDAVGLSDQRDRDIAHLGSRVGQAFLVIAGIGVLVLCAVEAHWFWVANTMFLGFATSAFVGGLASVIAYRRGLV